MMQYGSQEPFCDNGKCKKEYTVNQLVIILDFNPNKPQPQ